VALSPHPQARKHRILLTTPAFPEERSSLPACSALSLRTISRRQHQPGHHACFARRKRSSAGPRPPRLRVVPCGRKAGRSRETLGSLAKRSCEDHLLRAGRRSPKRPSVVGTSRHAVSRGPAETLREEHGRFPANARWCVAAREVVAPGPCPGLGLLGPTTRHMLELEFGRLSKHAGSLRGRQRTRKDHERWTRMS